MLNLFDGAKVKLRNGTVCFIKTRTKPEMSPFVWQQDMVHAPMTWTAEGHYTYDKSGQRRDHIFDIVEK